MKNSSILDQFKERCPGTYKHCQNVAALCETISRDLPDVDAEVLIAAALYHDIGKMNNPEYFSENQSQDINPHDNIEPHCSFQYISRHVADSVLKLIQVGEIDTKVILCVSEHHGDTVVVSLHNHAKKAQPDISEDHFRYKNRKPTTIESCVLMICDVIESACRSMYNAGKLDNIKKTIDELTEKLENDEQLDILAIGHMRVIKNILYKEIESTYHKRVDYEENDGTSK